MREERGFIRPHAEEVREGAMGDFEENWHRFSSPSAAAREIAAVWGVGRTTLTEWLQSEGRWPRATLAEVRRSRMLADENRRLRAMLDRLERGGESR
ncbi:hypothetical protein EKI59_09770 [Corynebacterium sanguinis]|uniref:Transposase n=1 Tax=Corynebacterium sanguinis TaxID=2594913 RepID=A0A6C1TV42_9CORY|nr:hypothetical protein EKI59_09770 [Corynebacterium sanguinis]